MLPALISIVLILLLTHTGTAFVEVFRDGSLKYLGRLPTQTVPSIWRDMKVIDGYAYIGSEAAGHGLQIFNMRKLLSIKSPKVFDIATDLTAHFTGFGNSHNIVANEKTKFIYAVGTSFCGKGGLFFVDVSNPAKPKDAGCASEDGYVHDAQCIIYTGPHKAYRGKEICFGYNEDSLTIYDVTNKAAPAVISRTTYTGARYTHQGWLANNEMTHLLMDDELDEIRGTAPNGTEKTTTYLWDITNLEAPKNTGIYKSQAKSIDHNQYVLNGLSYMSNYASGLRVVDVSSIAKNPTGAEMVEMGHFDVYPEDDDAQVNEFYGSWSVYPYFKSGVILINSIERGVFAVRYTGKGAKYAKGRSWHN
jgi:choice-of-anchor B domain-containing protein